jgi:hypothetical protein
MPFCVFPGLFQRAKTYFGEQIPKARFIVKGFQVGIECDIANVIVVFGVGGLQIFHRFWLVA